MTTRGADPLAAVAALPGVEEAASAAREAVDALARDRVARRRGPEVAACSAVRSAWASAALEGSEVDLERLRAGTGDPTAVAALRVLAATAALVDTWARAPRQVLARLHVLAGADLVGDPDLLGRPVTAAAADRLDALSDLLTMASAAPAIVVAAVAHAEVLTVAPFGPGSGLVARAASRLVLCQRGVDPGALSAPEAGHHRLGVARYRAAAEGYAAGGTDGVAAWVRHCADAVAAGAQTGRQVCRDLRAAPAG